MPFPREETTPPVTKMYLVALLEPVMNGLDEGRLHGRSRGTVGAPALTGDNVSGNGSGPGPQPRVALASTNLITPEAAVKSHAEGIDSRRQRCNTMTWHALRRRL